VEVVAVKLRYRLVAALCWLLRHPDHTVNYIGGTSRTRCPCGHIDFGMRSFRAHPPSTEPPR
jgi:hypothetical protein